MDHTIYPGGVPPGRDPWKKRLTEAADALRSAAVDRASDGRDRVAELSKLTGVIERPRPLGAKPRPLEEIQAELDRLVGLESVKEQVRAQIAFLQIQARRSEHGLAEVPTSKHLVFLGNPGTGKTTVARILTKIYKALGILERGHMVETDRQGLVAGFVGQTALKTTERIDEAMGGVLFIDEAYALTSGGFGGASADYGNEVVQTILKRMEDQRGEFFVFAAGYPENMEGFLKANPGLRSRFDKILRFEDYSEEELFQIAIKMIADKGYDASERARLHLQSYLAFLRQYRDRYFGNARTVRTVINQAIKNQNLRLAGQSKEHRQDLNLIKLEDVQEFEKNTEQFVFNKSRIGFRSSDR